MLKKLILGLALAAASILPSQAMARGHGDRGHHGGNYNGGSYYNGGHHNRGYYNHRRGNHHQYRNREYRGGGYYNRQRIIFHQRGNGNYYQPRHSYYSDYDQPPVRCYFDQYGDRYCRPVVQHHYRNRSNY